MENDNGEKEHKTIRGIAIIYEDDDVVVIDKPSGLLVHGDGRNKEETVVEWLLLRAPSARGVGEPHLAQDGTPLERSGVVHRLDRDTSGVLILAKTQEAFVHLKAQFHDRLAQKEYHAFVYGTMKDRWGTINRPIGRSARDFRLRSAERGARGVLRPSMTDWECLMQSSTHAYLKVTPKTGRTHQIRVHLKSVGHPIVCDPIYTPVDFRKKDSLGFTRLALHAYTLTMALPKGITQTFIAPLPQDFERAKEVVASM